jgi:hypothetical protein
MARGVHPAVLPSWFHIVMLIGGVKRQRAPSVRWSGPRRALDVGQSPFQPYVLLFERFRSAVELQHVRRLAVVVDLCRTLDMFGGFA